MVASASDNLPATAGRQDLQATAAKQDLQATAAKQDLQATAALQASIAATHASITGAVNEAAPASDTASSGLNGRLQRIAQRLTSHLTAVGEVQATPTAYTLLGRLKSVYDALTSIGSDTTPVAVTNNAKAGSYAFSAIGSPSVSTSGASQVSTAFVPNGEKVTLMFSPFRTGDHTMGTDAYVYLECDLTGATTFRQVAGTKVMLSDLPDTSSSTKTAFINTWNVRGGNCRARIFFGTLGGSSGDVGYNVSLLN